MSYLTAITLFHTGISLVAIGAGAVAIAGLFHGGAFRHWTNLFLITAVVTSVTGFFFPFNGVTPAQIVGVLALLILAVVLLAFYRFHVVRAWRWIYALGMVASLYLLVFVGVVQAFQKIGFIHGLAPTQSEPPFLIAQGATLLFFIVLGIVTAIRYRPEVASARLG
jgi:cell division protein FtsW (lipid II flippase)